MSSQRRLETIMGHLRGGRAGDQSVSISPTAAGGGGSHSTGSRYKYTIDTPMLTSSQRDFYEQNGFLVVRGLVSKDKLDEYRTRFRQLCSGEVKCPGITVMKDVAIAKSEFKADERAITKVQNFQHEPVLSRYCSLPEVLQYVECFTGPDIMAMHTMLINKPPDPGSKSSRHPLHQDLYYFPFRPADRIVCSWTAMEKVNRQNGCLVVLPGTHKGELLPHDYPKWEGGVNKMYHGITTFDPNAHMVHLEMEAGDTVFFHPILIHGSGMNRTAGFRKAISCHYASSSCDYIDVKGTNQQVIADEVENLVKKNYGEEVQISYQTTWEIKGLHVKGRKINL